MTRQFLIGAVFVSTFFGGCGSSQKQVLLADESAVKLRSIQSRVFDTTDKTKMLRTTMATLQDLGFVVDSADDSIGTVSATKLDRYALRMTVTVRPRNERQLLVRASAQYNLRAVESPEPYQNFFAALEKAIFLTAHMEEDRSPASGSSTGTPSSQGSTATVPAKGSPLTGSRGTQK